MLSRLWLCLSFWFLHVFACMGQIAIPEFSPLIKGSITPRTLAVQDDGKILLGSADLKIANNQLVNGFVRLNPDGSIDDTFELQARISDRGRLLDIIVQPDGKIIVSGSGIFPDHPSDIIRFNEDGSIDDSFNLDEDFKGVPNVELQPDGKIVLVSFDLFPNPLRRLNPDGSFDDTFFVGSGPSSYGEGNFDIRSQQDGKIIVVGSFSQFNDTDVNGIVRLNLDGTIDSDFDVGTGMEVNSGFALLRTLTIQSDGKIVLAGNFDSFNGYEADGIVRLNPDGSVDPSFQIPALPTIGSIKVLPDDKILITTTSYLFRLQSNGRRDASFRPGRVDNLTTNGIGYPLQAVQTDDKIVVAGDFMSYSNYEEMRIGLMVIENNGDLTDFDAQIGGIPHIYTTEVQEDNKIIVGGKFLAIEDSPANNLGRINADGSPDEQFNSNLGEGFDRRINDILLQEDGKIIVGGAFNYFNNDWDDDLIIRLNNDGTLDSSFNPDLAHITSSAGVSSIKYQNEEQIIVAGDFRSSTHGVELNHFVRLNLDDGSTDVSFNADNQFSPETVTDEIFEFAFQSNGSIIVGGRSFDRRSFGVLTRTDANGIIDATFTPPEVTNKRPLAISILSNDEIIVGGTFAQTFYQNDPSSIFHLAPDGQLIRELEGNLRGSLKSLHKIDDNNLVFGGDFVSLNEVDRQSLAIGSISGDVSEFDAIFEPGSQVEHIERLNNNTILVSGRFTSIGNQDGYCGIAMMTLPNNIPEVTDLNQDLSLFEDTSLDIEIEQFTIEDFDNDYPDDFSLLVFEGDNYSLNGNILTPEENFFGDLDVQVQVTDGIYNSEPFMFKLPVLPVNDKPVITTTYPKLTNEETALEISLEDIEIQDIDNSFPDDFSLLILDGDHYTHSNNLITPTNDFNGHLMVGVRAFDGADYSETSYVEVEVQPINDIPVITGAENISTLEETPVEITLTELHIIDPDNTFPDQFELIMLDGDGYTLQENMVYPDTDINGQILVNLQVSDGIDLSDISQIVVDVIPVNDKPVISGSYKFTLLEDTPLPFTTTDIIIIDPDDKSFDLIVQDGENYTYNNYVILPALNFHGEIIVPVMVFDGEEFSDIIEIDIAVESVNDVPSIINTTDLITEEDVPLEILFEHIEVVDPDNNFPNDFSINILNGDHYTFDANTIIPEANYNGTLSLNLSVTDGIDESEVVIIPLEVLPVNDAPTIISSQNLSTTQGTSIQIDLSHFTVIDPDNNYPSDFELVIFKGDNYTITDNVIHPNSEFVGDLTVHVTISDGDIFSPIYQFAIPVSVLTSNSLENSQIDLSLYPNPVENILEVRFQNQLAGAIDIQLIGLDGSFHYSQNVIIHSEESIHSIDMSNLSSGMYLFRIINSKSTKITRLLIKE